MERHGMSTENPTITITEAALRAFRAAAEADDIETDSVVRLTIDARYQNDLFFGAREPGDVEVTASGLALAMDAASARRADGVTIDFVEGPTGTGFKIENPNLSPPVKGIRPADLRRMLDAREKLVFVDARSAEERAKAQIAAAQPLDEAALLAMPKETKMVFMAHHGRGGQSAARRFFDRGFKKACYVSGGIDAWSTMDPSVPRY
jgi:monothiol glutaredoxin